jgi:hypothetical protein
LAWQPHAGQGIKECEAAITGRITERRDARQSRLRWRR